MYGKPLQVVQEESDLGVTSSSDLKHAEHSKLAYKRASKILGFISRIFEYNTPVVMPLFEGSAVRGETQATLPLYFRKDATTRRVDTGL